MAKIDKNQAYEALKRFVGLRSTQVGAALDLGITPQYLSDILQKRRPISEMVAKRLGFERVTLYRSLSNLKSEETK